MKRLLVLMILLGTVGVWPVTAQGDHTPMTPQNAASITQLAQLGNGNANDIAWTPDGSRLAVAGTGIRFYNPANPVEEQFPPIDYYMLPAMSVAYSPDGSLLAWRTQKHLAVSDENTGMILWTKETEWGGWGDSLAFSPDGDWLVSNGPGTINVWDPASGTLVYELTNGEGWGTGMAFLPDGTLVAGSYGGRIHWLDVRTGSELRSVENQSGDVRLVAVSPEGDLLATSDIRGEVMLWQANTGQQVGQLSTGEGFS